MTEIQKIKDLFNSSDTSNHKLAYILAKSQLGMNDKEICYMILNDGDGWKDLHQLTHMDTDKVKYIFNGRIFYMVDIFPNSTLYFQFECKYYTDYFKTSDIKLGKRLDKLNEWFSKLDK